MRKSKFSAEEIEIALNKLENGATIEEICKKMGVTMATIYNWKKKFTQSGVSSSQASQNLKELQEENFRLKQLVAHLSLEKQDLMELLKKRN